MGLRINYSQLKSQLLKSTFLSLLLVSFIANSQANSNEETNVSSITSIGELASELNLAPFFIDSFDDMQTHHWQEDGNWKGDMQNDATAFAPELLYMVADYLGPAGDEFYQRAYKTSQYEYSVIFDVLPSVFRWDLDAWQIFDAAVGGYSYVSCNAYGRGVHKTLCDLFLIPVLNIGTWLLNSPIYEAVGIFDSLTAVVLSRAAQINVDVYRTTEQPHYLNNAARLMKKLESITNADDDGYYEGNISGWSQASPLVAYSVLYSASGDESYLEKVEKILAVQERDFLFGVPEVSEAYWEIAHIDLGSNQDEYVLAASTHAQFFESYVVLYEATGSEYYLEKAERFLSFAVNELYLGDLDASYDGYLDVVRSKPHFTHDITWVAGEIDGANAEVSLDYCTGESFNFLRIYWRLVMAKRYWEGDF